ncbi:flagellar motor switch protein FliM [Piscirickettsia salmonis]|uniref:flagellar motor switch protein FliM n=1 Tax=Piscirickettsia salmonis TaxID=1238 RepID=UPI00375160D5
MSTDLLSQDEIDALLHGVDGSESAEEVEVDPDAPVSIDFNSQERIVRGRMPTLEMVNERFARTFRTTLFNLLRSIPDLSVDGIQMHKFSDYMHTLFVPTSLNMVKMRPLRGNCLFVFDARLIFILVDNFFGSDGRFHAKIEGREFTPTELRIVMLLLETIFIDYKEAWAPVLDVNFEYQSSEVNPAMANIVGPTEAIFVSTFQIELNGGGGKLQIGFPYPMIEPIRDILDAGIQSDSTDIDTRWIQSLHHEIVGAPLRVTADLAKVELSAREIMQLKAGQIIPFEMPEEVQVFVQDTPAYMAKLGQANGNLAIELVKEIDKKTGVAIPFQISSDEEKDSNDHESDGHKSKTNKKNKK